jgi:hypothetical protein
MGSLWRGVAGRRGYWPYKGREERWPTSPLQKKIWIILQEMRLQGMRMLPGRPHWIYGCEGAHNVVNSPKTLMRAAVPRTHFKTASRGVFCE